MVKGVTVILPAFNEAHTIARLVRSAISHTPNLFEVLVVDDGSTDATSTEASQAGARVLRLDANQGKGCALRHGIANAQSEMLVLIDADGQDDPREIPPLLAALVPGVDMVIGSRFLGHFGDGAITPVNHAGNRFLTAALNLLFGTRITDSLAGFKAVRRATFDRFELRARRFDIEVEIIIAILATGGRIIEVPVGREAREHGVSRLDAIRDGLRILRRMLAMRFFHRN